LPKIPRLDPEGLRARRAADGNVVVLDVRTADARVVQPFQIPGSRWLPLADVAGSAPSLPRAASIVTYCT